MPAAHAEVFGRSQSTCVSGPSSLVEGLPSPLPASLRFC